MKLNRTPPHYASAFRLMGVAMALLFIVMAISMPSSTSRADWLAFICMLVAQAGVLGLFTLLHRSGVPTSLPVVACEVVLVITLGWVLIHDPALAEGASIGSLAGLDLFVLPALIRSPHVFNGTEA